MTDRGSDGDPSGTAAAGSAHPGPYVAVRSVDTGSIARIAAGADRLALASVSGGVTVLAPDGDGQFAVEGRPGGLAVGSLVYVAVEGAVFGFEDDGTRRWEADVDGVSGLCWLPEPEQVVAATDGGEFVILDGATGAERRRIDRAHADVSEDVSLAGRAGEFLAGESWYLTGFDADGDRRGEAMLDGTITGIGLLDGIAVVSLHGDRIVGVGDDGATRWSRDAGVEWLAPRGAAGVYAATDRGIVRIGPDGDTEEIGLAPEGAAGVAITTDGGLACRIDGRTAEVLRPQSAVSGVDLELSPASLTVGEDVTVAVERRGPPTTGTVGVASEDASFDPSSQPVSLAAGERTSLRFTLDDADDERVRVRTEFAPDGDGDAESTESTLRVAAAPSDLDVDAECLAIDGGEASVEATLRMPDGSDLPAVSIDPGDVAVGAEEGRSSATRRFAVPLGTDRLTVTAGDGEPIDAPVSVPSRPLSASLTGRDEGFVDVTLANDAAVPVDDEVRVTGDPLPAPVERSVSLDPDDRITLAVPTVRPTGTVRVDAAAVSATGSVDLDDAALPGGRRTDRSAETRSDSRRRDDPERGPGAGAAAGARGDRTRTADGPPSGGSAASPRESPSPDTEADREPPAEQTARDDPAPAEADPASPAADPSDPASSPAGAADRPAADTADRHTADTDSADRRTADTDTADRHTADTDSPARPAADTDTERPTADASRSEPTPSSGPSGSAASPDPLDLSRSLTADTVREGHAIEETLTVTNRASEPQSITIESGEERATVELRPGATATGSRYHAGWDVGAIDLPPAVARAGGAEATVPSASVPIEDAPVVVRPALTVRSASTDVRLDVRNNLDTPCSVLEIGSKGFSGSVGFDGFEVAAGATGSRETTYEGTPAERPALTFVRIDQRRRPLQTLAAVHESATPPVAVTVASVDVLDDRDTNVVFEVRNESGTALDVRLEAAGDAPDEYLYSAGEIEGLAPGATETHRVECTVEDDRFELPIEVSTTPSDGGDSQSTTVTASGDRTAGADAWEVDAGGAADPEAPSTLSTPLSITASE